MHRAALGDAQPNCAHFSVHPELIEDPHAASPFNRSRRDASLGAHAHDGPFDAPYEAHDIDGGRKLDDRVAHELTRTVPGDLATPIDINHGGAVTWTLDLEGAPTSGIDRLMLEKKKRIWAFARNHLRVDLFLHIPRGVVVNGTGRKIEIFVSGFNPGIFGKSEVNDVEHLTMLVVDVGREKFPRARAHV